MTLNEEGVSVKVSSDTFNYKNNYRVYKNESCECDIPLVSVLAYYLPTQFVLRLIILNALRRI